MALQWNILRKTPGAHTDDMLHPLPNLLLWVRGETHQQDLTFLQLLKWHPNRTPRVKEEENVSKCAAFFEIPKLKF